MVRAAELHEWIERAEDTGVRSERARIDWSELITFKRTFTDPITPWKESKFTQAGIRQLHGAPRFTSPTKIAVDGDEMECGKIVVATEAVPVELSIPGQDLLTTSDDFLVLDELPGRVQFVAGAYPRIIGLQLRGYAYVGF